MTLMLLPSLVIGLLLGYAAYVRESGAFLPRWLVFSPARRVRS
ncbi:hypothetical protein [Jiangella asiatica]|nr:hypothetical protein [Jiangella asiatica]